jgi:hypothetical protein
LVYRREPISIIPVEESVNLLIRIDAQKFSNYFNSQHVAVKKAGLRSMLMKSSAFEPIVNQTLHADQIADNIHGEDIRSYVFV